MQKENCRNRQFSLGFGKPGHGLSFLSATVMKAKRDLNNLRPCLNTEGCGGEEPPEIKNGHNRFLRVGGKRSRKEEDEVDLRSRLLRHGKV